MKRIPVTVVSGYLGSGKTTLILNILKARKYNRTGLIVNDFSEKNVDADILEKSPYLKETDQLIPISNGSISSDLMPQLEDALFELGQSQEVDYILVEDSGIATPRAIAQLITQARDDKGNNLSDFTRLDSMVTVADSYRLAQQFNPSQGRYNDDFLESNQLIIKQIEYCDVLILNKLDLITESEHRYITNMLRTIQPNARLIETTFSKVIQDYILDTQLFDESKTVLDDLDTECLSNLTSKKTLDLGIESFVYRRRRPFHPKRLDSWLNQWPPQITRCKGVMWLVTQPSEVFKVSQSGRAMDIIPSGYWIAALKQWEIDKLFTIRPHLHDLWHERFGDRMTELVFIGKDMNKNQIIEDLDHCLYLDNEDIPYHTDPFKYS